MSFSQPLSQQSLRASQPMPQFSQTNLPYHMQEGQVPPTYPGARGAGGSPPRSPRSYSVLPPAHAADVPRSPRTAYPNIHKVQMWSHDQVQARIMMLGILACCCAAILPILGCMIMLFDENYVFWEGRTFPLKVISLCLSVVILLCIVCACLHRKAPRHLMNEHTMAVVVATFSALLGVSLVLLALPSSRDLYNTAGRIASGCSNSLPESTLLVDYSQVLYNMRKDPACAANETIEYCDGWKENRYTGYIKYLEKEFHCGPLCPSLVPAATTPEGALPALVQERPLMHTSISAPKQRKSLSLRSDTLGRESPAYEIGQHEVEHQALLQQHQMPLNQPVNKLFSFGETRMECYPLIATRLRVLAWHNNDLTFWEGFGLICVSVMTSAVAFLSMVCAGDQTRRQPMKAARA